MTLQPTPSGTPGQPAQPKQSSAATAIIGTALLGAVAAILTRHFHLPEDENDAILSSLEKLLGTLFR